MVKLEYTLTELNCVVLAHPVQAWLGGDHTPFSTIPKREFELNRFQNRFQTELGQCKQALLDTAQG